jgi:hypothetical protein
MRNLWRVLRRTKSARRGDNPSISVFSAPWQPLKISAFSVAPWRNLPAPRLERELRASWITRGSPAVMIVPKFAAPRTPAALRAAAC